MSSTTQLPLARSIAAIGASILLALTLALTGCSSDRNLPVYDFSNAQFATADDQGFRMQAPEGLLEVAAANDGFDPEQMPITAWVIKPYKLDSAKYCAIELTPTWSKDGVEAMKEYVEARGLPIRKSGNETFALNTLSTDTDTPGTYVADDWSSMVVVTTCARALDDDSGYVRVALMVVNPNEEHQIGFLAEADLVVMKSGTLGVEDSDTGDYVRDSEGNWILG